VSVLSETLNILVDIDIPIFAAACVGETKTVWQEKYTDDQGIIHEEIATIEYDLEKAKNYLAYQVAHITAKVREHFDWTKDYKVTMCLSHKDNFRKTLNPMYKSNRVTPKPKLLPEVRAFVESKYNTECWDNLEADDVLSILGTTLDNSVVCSIDKDMLTIKDTIVYNWKRDTFEVTDPKTAQWHHYYQTLKGDSVDGFGGAKGIGDIRARAILEAECSWEAVEATFISKKQTKEDSLMMARMAKLLTPELYDRATGTVYQWMPPSYQGKAMPVVVTKC
jgi:hypothetical protein